MNPKYTCRRCFETASGYTICCGLAQNHEGEHQGWCLGSRAFFPRGYASDEEIYWEHPSFPEELETY